MEFDHRESGRIDTVQKDSFQFNLNITTLTKNNFYQNHESLVCKSNHIKSFQFQSQ